jgi:hypothetical protein
VTDAASMLEKQIRDQYPSPRFRMSRREYPAGTSLPCVVSEALCYVLEGACRYRNSTFELEIRAGERGALRPGEFQFEVLGDSKTVLVHIWDLEVLGVGPGTN